MKVKTFVISVIIVCVILVVFGIVAVRDSKRMHSEQLKQDSIYAVVDSLSRQCSSMDSIIRVQDNKIKSLMSAQSEVEKRLNINDKKIKNNNRVANNAIKGLALKYAIDYYYGND